MRLGDMTIEQFAKWCEKSSCDDCVLDNNPCGASGLLPCCLSRFDLDLDIQEVN